MFGFISAVVIISIVLALLIPIAIIWLIAEVIQGIARSASGTPQRPAPGWGRPGYDPAAEQLRYRFASGQIGQVEFEAGMRSLGYEKVG